jgi:hypothetical protein
LNPVGQWALSAVLLSCFRKSIINASIFLLEVGRDAYTYLSESQMEKEGDSQIKTYSSSDGSGSSSTTLSF